MKDEDKIRMVDVIAGAVIRIVAMLAIAAIVILNSSCTTHRVVEVPVVSERITHDTIYKSINVIMRDTITMRDCVVVRNDGEDRWKFIEKIREVETHDTVYKNKTDTVPKYIHVVNTVCKEKKQPWYNTLLMALGYVVVAAVIALLAVGLKRIASYMFRNC